MMGNFWQHYWWIIVLIVLVVIIAYCLYRFFQFYHLDYHWERKIHFPQWSNEGIITKDNYFLHTEFNFVDKSNYIIIGVHGMGNSLTDFKKTAQFFSKHHISFLSFDQRGFGENEKWKYHTLGTTINDIKDVITVLKERYPNQKILLMGEGLGSAIIALASKKLPKLIHGVILTNCITKKQLCKWKPNLFFQMLWGFCFYKQQQLPFTFDYEKLSSNKNYIEKSKIRTLTTMKFSLLFMLQAQKLNQQMAKNLNYSKCPALLIQSGEDIFADFNKIAHHNKHWRNGITYNFYPNGKHALLNEPNLNDILTAVMTWLKTTKI